MKNTTILEYVPCNLCGSTDYKIMYQPTKKDYDPSEIFSASGGVMGTQQIVKCNHCGLVYVNPRVKNEIVVNAYSDAVDELYVSQAEGRQKTFNNGLKLVEKYVPQRGTILDVGCAAGFFLNVAKKAGWQTYGIEPSKWMSDWGNKKFNVNIKNGTLKDAKLQDEFFDVVTMWDVLEHTSDPMGELAEVNRILKKDGILIINFPNVASKLARVAGGKWWFFLSVHLYHFSPRSMSMMLAKNDFEVIKFSRHYQTLSLEHLVKMVGLYSKGVSKLGLKVINGLSIEDWLIPYYASQANVIAKKK